MARFWWSRVPRLLALAAGFAAFTQNGFARWALLATFVLILLAEVAWEERQQRKR